MALNIGKSMIGVDQAEDVVRGMFPSSSAQESDKPRHIAPQFTKVIT